MGLLFLSLFNSILGLSVLFPVLGPLGRELGLGDSEIGLISSGYALSQFIFAPMWGRASETRGRKPILLIGVSGFGVGFLAFGFVCLAGQAGILSGTGLVAALVATRLLGGALSSATLPTAQAYAADLSDDKNRASAMGIIGAAFGLAIIFGPALGALVSHFFGLLAPVWLSVAMSVLNTVLVLVKLPESPRKRVSASSDRSAVAKRVWAFLAVSFVATLASVAMEQTIAFAFEDRLHLAHADTPKYVGAGLVAYGIVAVFVQGFLVRRWKTSPRTFLLLGLPIAAVGLGLLTIAFSFPTLVLALTLQGFGQGLVMPGVTTAMSLAVSEDDQGAVAGANSAAQGLGRLFGPLIGSRLYEILPALPYSVAAGLMTLVFGFVVLSKSTRKPSTQPAA